MRVFDVATTQALAQGGGAVARMLVYVWALNRTSGEIEEMGLWSGSQDRTFTIRGASRVYTRAAGMLGLDEIIAQPGTDVMFTQLMLSSVDPAVWQLLEAYEPRFAPVEVHRALFHPLSGDLVAEPHRVFRGWIDKAPRPTPEVGGDAEMKISLASANRGLTRGLPFAKSDPALAQARSGDRFRRYTDVGTVMTPWGEARVGANSSSSDGFGSGYDGIFDFGGTRRDEPVRPTYGFGD